MGDSCFPGQGVIAVAFSGVMCAHRVAADLGQSFRSLSLFLIEYLKLSTIGSSHKVDRTVVFDAFIC